MSPEVKNPVNDAGNSAAEGAEPTNGKDAGDKGTPAVNLAELRSQIDSLKEELEKCHDRFLRKAAEFENYRKRTDKERGEAAQLAKSSILMEFLPIADACERALKKMDEPQRGDESLEHYREGVRLLYKQIHDVFTRIGVVPVEAEGQKFDPHFHEAVAREEDPGQKDNTVVGELRRGYLFKGRLLRPAQVRVAIHPQPKFQAD